MRTKGITAEAETVGVIEAGVAGATIKIQRRTHPTGPISDGHINQLLF